MEISEQYQRFIGWQCRLRKMSMREMGGRPSIGMSAGVHSVSGGDEKARMNFLILKQESAIVASDLRHIVRKTQDPTEWIKNGLRLLSEWHYQTDKDFANQLTGLFTLDSALAEALIEAGECRLNFAETSIEHSFDFDVALCEKDSDEYQFTYWHNHLFNASIPGKVQVLSFTPRL
ncbi:MAG: hypothetical protein ACI9LO_001262 [Planctomycetota bacterium]|jgi:hypothetical protein